MRRIELDAVRINRNSVFLALFSMAYYACQFMKPGLERHEEIQLRAELARERGPDANTEWSYVQRRPVVLERNLATYAHAGDRYSFSSEPAAVCRDGWRSIEGTLGFFRLKRAVILRVERELAPIAKVAVRHIDSAAFGA